MFHAEVKHHFTKKLGVSRFHLKRRNQVANLVDLLHCGKLAKVIAAQTPKKAGTGLM
jgi:hypothetical protein